LPPEWRSLFKQAGITKKEARNPELAVFILGVIADNVPGAKPVNS